MSAKNRKLIEFYEEQGSQDDDAPRQADKTAWINGEQMRRSEEQMRDAPGAAGAGVSEAGAAGGPDRDEGHKNRP